METSMKILMTLVIVAVLITFHVDAQCTMNRTSITMGLDKDKFQGKWYVTSWYYQGTGRGKTPTLENAQSIYTLRDDGNFNITYAVGVSEGMCFSNPAMAMVDNAAPRKIWVFDFFLHQILDTDYSNYAVIYQCKNGMEFCSKNSTQLVVLGRKPQANPTSEDAIDKAVSNACINKSDMVAVSHSRSCLCEDGATSGILESCPM